MAADARAILGASLRRLAPVSERALAALASATRERAFAPGDWLLRGGDRATECFLITSGLVRELYVSSGGEEHTRTFLGEGQVTGSLVDLLSSAPAITWIEALEPTSTLVWRYDDFDALCTKFTDLGVVARRSAEALAIRKTRREHELLALSAAERHRRWLAEHGALDARVSRKLLASYLGITPEHLSRLRRERGRAGR